MKSEKKRLMISVSAITFCLVLIGFGQIIHAEELDSVGITLGDGMGSFRFGGEDVSVDGSFSGLYLSFGARELDYDDEIGSRDSDSIYRSYALRLELENGTYFGPGDRFFVSVEYGGGLALSQRPDEYDDYETLDIVGKLALNLGAVLLDSNKAKIRGGVGCARLATLVGEDSFDDATDTCYFRIENRFN